MSLLPARRRRRAEINIVPLVDVLVTLIFFFLVSMQFRNMNTLNIVPPKIETAGDNRLDQQIEVGISAEGEFFYNGVPVNEEEMVELLRQAARVNNEVPVVLMADENSALRWTTLIVDTCREVGLESLRLQSR